MPEWKPDEGLLAEARRTAADLARSLRDPAPCPPEGDKAAARGEEEERCAKVSNLLEALGTLVFLDEEESARTLVPKDWGSPDPDHEIETAISQVAGPALEIVAAEILLAAEDLGSLEDPEERASAEESIVEKLAIRDRIEIMMEGARVLTGRLPLLSEDLRTSIAAFDEVLEAELWRLLPLGSRRAARCAWASPRLRPRLWWWFKGCDLPHTILENLETVARLIHIFPETKQLLERRILAEREIEAVRESAGTLRPAAIPLRGFLLERREREREGHREPAGLPLAATDDEETVLFREGEIVLSCNGKELILDIESPAEPAWDHPPRLEVKGGGALEGIPTEPGRFVFPLSNRGFDAQSGVLKVFLTGEKRRIRLPFN